MSGLFIIPASYGIGRNYLGRRYVRLLFNGNVFNGSLYAINNAVPVVNA